MAPKLPAYRSRLAAGFILAALAAACSGSTPNLNSTPNSDTQAVAAITSPSAPGAIQMMVSGSGAALQAYQSMVDAFQQRHPGQAVDLVGIPGDTDFQKRLTADVAAGRPADVIVESYTDAPGLASRGLLAPVAPYVAASHAITLSQFATGTIGPFIFNRQLQCLPLSASGLVVYYNKDLFRGAALAEPGAHWSRAEFVADAQRLTRDTDGDGQTDQFGLGVAPSIQNLAPFILQLKGPLVDLPAWPSEMALGTPAAISATTWLVSLQSQYHVTPDEQDELAASSEQRFLDGSLAMLIDTRALVPDLRQITSFDWDAAPLPANNNSTTNVVVEDGLCLTADSANKSAAWQLIEFAASAEGQTILARSGAIVPALSSVADSPAFLDPAARPAHSQVFLYALAHAIALPKLENWSDIQAITDEELAQAFYGHKSVAQALDAATTRGEEYFKIHTTQ